MEDHAMSIVRVGLSETKNFAEGYEAIFGKKDPPAEPAAPQAEQPGDAPKPAEPAKPTGPR
jgi:hypothetical protein